MLAALMGPLAAFSSSLHDPSGVHLLNSDQGLTLVNTAWEHGEQVSRKPDCSHLVHQIYELSGYPYPYASSFDLYHGIDNFWRVAKPHPGDLVVWRGHVGIVVDAAEHTFYSSVRSGLRTEYYDGPYWRAQGRPRFYRYAFVDLTAINSSGPATNSWAQTKRRASLTRVGVRLGSGKTQKLAIPSKAERRSGSPVSN